MLDAVHWRNTRMQRRGGIDIRHEIDGRGIELCRRESFGHLALRQLLRNVIAAVFPLAGAGGIGLIKGQNDRVDQEENAEHRRNDPTAVAEQDEHLRKDRIVALPPQHQEIEQQLAEPVPECIAHEAIKGDAQARVAEEPAEHGGDRNEIEQGGIVLLRGAQEAQLWQLGQGAGQRVGRPEEGKADEKDEQRQPQRIGHVPDGRHSAQQPHEQKDAGREGEPRRADGCGQILHEGLPQQQEKVLLTSAADGCCEQKGEQQQGDVFGQKEGNLHDARILGYAPSLVKGKTPCGAFCRQRLRGGRPWLEQWSEQGSFGGPGDGLFGASLGHFSPGSMGAASLLLLACPRAATLNALAFRREIK